MKLYPTDDELSMIFKRYDRDRDGMLSFDEFVELICPRNESYRSMLLARNPKNCRLTYANASFLSPSTFNDFGKLLDTILKTER